MPLDRCSLRRIAAAFVPLVPSLASAAEPAADAAKAAADTVWIVAAAALVFLMQAGFALLESGASRSKNTVNVILKNYTDVCLGSLVFWLVGFGLMFGANPTGWLGTDRFALGYAAAGDWTFILFQTMFAATAATIASGALAERVRFEGYLIASLLCTALVYPVFGAWAWGAQHDGQGWLRALGFIDFAGSTVVHSVGGWFALAGVIVLGPRLGRYGPDGTVRPMPGHSLPLVAMGGFILWFGWFGFNGGSTLAAQASIGQIVLNTHLAASAGAAGAYLHSLLRGQPLTVMNLVNGSLGGLVAITAGCASMQPHWAVVTGLAAGALVLAAQLWIERRGWDDVVGAVAVHGVCGVWGTLAAGLFHQDGLFDPARIGVQLVGIAAAFLWTFPLGWLIFKVLAAMGLLRASVQDQQRGLDYSEHAEIGYPEFQRDLLHAGRSEV